MGFIRERNGKYQVRVNYKTDTGEWKETTRTCKSPREAKKVLAELESKIYNGEFFVPEKITVQKYLEKWLKNYALLNLQPKTYKSYKELIESYINPGIGQLDLSKLKPVQLQDFYTSCMTELKLSSTTTLYLHRILHVAFKHAVQWQIIKINPADNVEKPKKSKHNVNVLTLEESKILIKDFKGTNHYILVLLALTTGMRRSELLGLKWQNVDLEKGVIYVENQLQDVDGILQLVPTKTESSRRKIDMLNYTIPILKKHREYQEKNSEDLKDYSDEGFVICNPLTGKPYDPDYITRHFARRMKVISKNTGIPDVTFHELRHTHATHMLLAGISPKIVSERLGHTTISMTLDTYTSVLPSMQKEAAEKLDTLFIENKDDKKE